MNVIILLLIIAMFMISLMPTTEEEKILHTQKTLAHCDIHKWISKPSGIDENNYTVCEKCGFLPEINNYEVDDDFKV